MKDITAIVMAESECFPPAEAAARNAFIEIVKHYAMLVVHTY